MCEINFRPECTYNQICAHKFPKVQNSVHEHILFELTIKFKIAQAIEKASWCIKLECNDRSAIFVGKGVSDLETCTDYFALQGQRCKN